MCCLPGYVAAFSEHLASAELGISLFDVICHILGVPKEIFSDHDKLVNAEFFQSFCQLSGIEEYRCPVYHPRRSGRAERAVLVVSGRLRKLFAQTGKGRRWIYFLPLALWCANNLAGPISGISPHRLVFGRDPIGFGEYPPTDPEVGCEDALQFFNRVRSERQFAELSFREFMSGYQNIFLLSNSPRNLSQGTAYGCVCLGSLVIVSRVGSGLDQLKFCIV